jgi:hypothetical protein
MFMEVSTWLDDAVRDTLSQMDDKAIFGLDL